MPTVNPIDAVSSTSLAEFWRVNSLPTGIGTVTNRPMTPQEFLSKWRHVELKERSASQSHFNDLCALLGVLDPIAADPKGEWFAFEKGASKTTGGEGWADVWRRGCFAWEYKGPKKDLDKAFAQLLQYAVALENPPLLIVSDMDRRLVARHALHRSVSNLRLLAGHRADWADHIAHVPTSRGRHARHYTSARFRRGGWRKRLL